MAKLDMTIAGLYLTTHLSSVLSWEPHEKCMCSIEGVDGYCSFVCIINQYTHHTAIFLTPQIDPVSQRDKMACCDWQPDQLGNLQ